MAIDLNELATAIGQLVLRFRMRRDTAAGWTSANPVLLSAEEGYETDTKKRKIGDGTTAWNALAYSSGGVQSVVAGTGVTVDSTDPFNPIVNVGAGVTGNLTPDTHPSSPTPYDDEFEYGTAFDTTGARRTSANSWTLTKTSGTTAPLVGQGAVGADYSSGLAALALQAVPGVDCTFVMKTKRRASTSNSTWCLTFYNSGNGKTLCCQLATSPTMVVQRGSFNTSTWVYTGSVNAYTASTITNVDQPIYFRLRLSGTTVYFGFSGSGQDADWLEPYNEAIATWLGGLTHVGMFISASTGIVDWFRRTA